MCERDVQTPHAKKSQRRPGEEGERSKKTMFHDGESNSDRLRDRQAY
jgi:hypothetical protein